MQRSLLSFFPNPKKPRYDDNGQDNDSNDNDSSGDELVDNVQEKEVSEVHEVCEDSQDSQDTTHTRSQFVILLQLIAHSCQKTCVKGNVVGLIELNLINQNKLIYQSA